MSRGKLSLKLISSHKSRAATFHKRKKSLMKKAYELSTLCAVPTCVLINGPAPAQCGDRSEFYTWPPNRDEIEGMIRAYKANCAHKVTKRFDLSDFFSDRTRKVKAERSKIRNDVVEIERLSEDQLRLFVDALSSKIEDAGRMIDFMEGDYDHLLLGEQACAIDFIPLLPCEGDSVPTMSIEEFDPSDLFGLDEAEFTREHLHSLLNELDNHMIAFRSTTPL